MRSRGGFWPIVTVWLWSCAGSCGTASGDGPERGPNSSRASRGSDRSETETYKTSTTRWRRSVLRGHTCDTQYLCAKSLYFVTNHNRSQIMCRYNHLRHIHYVAANKVINKRNNGNADRRAGLKTFILRKKQNLKGNKKT